MPSSQRSSQRSASNANGCQHRRDSTFNHRRRHRRDNGQSDQEGDCEIEADFDYLCVHSLGLPYGSPCFTNKFVKSSRDGRN